MKLLNIHGEMVNVNVTQSRYPPRAKSKSILQGKVKDYLVNTYPHSVVLEEFFLPNSRKSVDFFMPLLKIVIEVQGSGHTGQNSFFHGPPILNKFAKQIKHDAEKANWAEINGFKFIEIFKEEDIKLLENL